MQKARSGFPGGPRLNLVWFESLDRPYAPLRIDHIVALGGGMRFDARKVLTGKQSAPRCRQDSCLRRFGGLA